MVKYTEVCFDERESSKNEVAQLMKLLQKETDELCPYLPMKYVIESSMDSISNKEGLNNG